MAAIRICAAAVALAALSVPAAAQAPSLAGKTVQMIIGFGSGGSYDHWGRVVASHMRKHLPGNPTIVPQNMLLATV
jgi:tripartite-type tricarboxylate transporter receptor subunit TctC